MRDIKFRGKRIDNGEWVYGNLIEHHEKSSVIRIVIDECAFEDVWVDPTTIGQFTGLPDKHGKEIFEGDIMQDSDSKRYKVEWNSQNGKWWLNSLSNDVVDMLDSQQLGNGYYSRKDLEIIGSIHDKELKE